MTDPGGNRPGKGDSDPISQGGAEDLTVQLSRSLVKIQLDEKSFLREARLAVYRHTRD
jgi:hypothetical protein